MSDSCFVIYGMKRQACHHFSYFTVCDIWAETRKEHNYYDFKDKKACCGVNRTKSPPWLALAWPGSGCCQTSHAGLLFRRPKATSWRTTRIDYHWHQQQPQQPGHFCPQVGQDPSRLACQTVASKLLLTAKWAIIFVITQEDLHQYLCQMWPVQIKCWWK